MTFEVVPTNIPKARLKVLLPDIVQVQNQEQHDRLYPEDVQSQFQRSTNTAQALPQPLASSSSQLQSTTQSLPVRAVCSRALQLPTGLQDLLTQTADAEDVEVELAEARYEMFSQSDGPAFQPQPTNSGQVGLRDQHIAFLMTTNRSQVTNENEKRYFKRYSKWLLENYGVSNPFSRNANTDMYIIIHIYLQCDPDLDRANHADNQLTKKNLSFSTAQQIRTAISGSMQRKLNCGDTPFTNEYTDGQWRGNPALSKRLANYMSGLRKRLIKAGDGPKSKKSLHPDDLFEIWRRNEDIDDQDRRQLLEVTRNYAIYVVTFLCCLRMNETLAIQLQHVTLAAGQSSHVEIRLPSRKNDQFGVSSVPFALTFNNMFPHLCPVRALTKYLSALTSSGLPVNEGGPLFVALGATGFRRGETVTYQVISNAFQKDMQRLYPVDYQLYNTHSFRRGGVQYLGCIIGTGKYAKQKIQPWSYKKLCEWGGWSEDFDTTSIFRYLYSVLDTASSTRVNYFQPVYQEEAQQ